MPHLEAWRGLVVDEPKRLHAVIDAPKFKKAFGDLDAEDRLKRVPPGYPADHPDAELLKLKDVLFGRRLTDAEALSPKLAGRPGRGLRHRHADAPPARLAGPEMTLQKRLVTPPRKA